MSAGQPACEPGNPFDRRLGVQVPWAPPKPPLELRRSSRQDHWDHIGTTSAVVPSVRGGPQHITHDATPALPTGPKVHVGLQGDLKESRDPEENAKLDRIEPEPNEYLRPGASNVGSVSRRHPRTSIRTVGPPDVRDADVLQARVAAGQSACSTAQARTSSATSSHPFCAGSRCAMPSYSLISVMVFDDL